MDDQESADQADPQLGLRRRPRTTGDQAAMPQIQLALGLFLVFMFLLILWLVWPFLSH